MSHDNARRAARRTPGARGPMPASLVRASALSPIRWHVEHCPWYLQLFDFPESPPMCPTELPEPFFVFCLACDLRRGQFGSDQWQRLKKSQEKWVPNPPDSTSYHLSKRRVKPVSDVPSLFRKHQGTFETTEITHTLGGRAELSP